MNGFLIFKGCFNMWYVNVGGGGIDLESFPL